MSDEIKKPDNIARIAPPNPARDTGARKNPRKVPERSAPEKRRRPPTDDQSHQVDEYA